MAKYLTMVKYQSGRVEVLTDRNEPEYKRRREMLRKLPSVLLVKTPSTEELRQLNETAHD